ncbi:MAG: hypothetical protein LBS22_02615, partial [Puniceicoccales bacterium]|nr:hypothetical protein [Puniceicoccales bacterium]
MGKREGEEKRRGTKQTRGMLVNILLMGSVLCVMLWAMLCGGCQMMGMGSGGRLSMPGMLSGQRAEL